MLSGIAIIHFDDMQKIHPFTYLGKIKSFVSEHQAKQLQRQVYINDRVKTMNESVYYNGDDIHTAINENKKIKFKYYKWDINKKLVPRHNGDWFVVSPWAPTWDDENYYMVAFDDLDQQIKHYRVDKMMRLSVEEEKRAGKDAFKNFDMAEYSKSTFGMYQGKKTRVKIEFANYMCGVFIDRFGKDITFRPIDDEHSELHVDVNVSRQFFGWIVIDGNGDWSYYQRAPGAEAAEMDHGIFTYSTDETSTYYADSTVYDGVSYKVFDFDSDMLIWGDEGAYYRME